MNLPNIPQELSISAALPPAQLLAAIARATRDSAPVTLDGADEDQFVLAAFNFAQYGYRCIGQTDDPTTHRFIHLVAERQHIVVAATNDNFHFLQPVMALMREQGNIVSQLSSRKLTQQTLLNALKHCDMAWFEWGDSAIIMASKLPKYCRLVCRIHRYELYASAFQQANWENIDEVILVSHAMKERFISLMGDKLPAGLQITVLANLTEHTFLEKRSAQRDPYAIACVARFSAQKNLVMLLPIMAALIQQNIQYKLYIVGRVEDQCLYESFCYLVKVYGLEHNVVLDGVLPADEMAEWYSNKSFFLSVSYHESQGMGIFEAMLAGLKPIAFHAAGGLSEYLPSRYLFTAIDEAVARISEGNTRPDDYVKEAQILLCQDTLRAAYSQIWQPKTISNTLLSIIIPCYNRQHYLLPAVCSALNQRDHRFEVLVVDDGSTDGSLDSLEHINDPRLSVIRKEHTNAPDTRNQGIFKAKGEYIIWLDSDDLLHANSLRRYRTLLQRWAHVDVISCGLEILGVDKKYFSLVNAVPANRLSQLAYGNFISNPGCCVRRELYAKVGNYNPRYHRAHDYEFWARAIGTAQVAFTSQCNISYRLHSNNITGIGKLVDSTYEYRIFNMILQRYKKEELFVDKNYAEVEVFIKMRMSKLYQECYLDNVLIIVNAIKKPTNMLITQIRALGLQKDRRFELLLISDRILPFSSQSVIIAKQIELTTIRKYMDEKYSGRYFRLFMLEDDLQNNQLLIGELKKAVLNDTLIPSSFRRIHL
ncbi:glycosyltransferase [Citrobacter portucalensis]|uniref:glycosyltransferase n=1 Tax=Citrobacter portucalensis TaxID=1639133 RepID=UPI0039FBAD5F|nr:glycosyltransferase [Citrobacter freundii]